MTAIKAEDYYAAHKDQEQEYVHVFVARPVKAGETVHKNLIGGIAADAGLTAPVDGYEVEDPLLKARFFLTADEFNERTIPAGDLPYAFPRKILSAEELAHFTPVRKGDTVTLHASSGVHNTYTADHNGFAITSGDNRYYATNHTLTSCFNYTGAKFDTECDIIVAFKEEQAYKGIILTEDVTLSLKTGDEYKALAGSFLCLTDKNENGFFVAPPTSGGPGLRLSTASAAIADTSRTASEAHEKAVENQEHLKKIAPRFKLK